MDFDELNIPKKEYSISIDTYFDKMDITEEQKEERREAANDLWWVLLLLFAMINTAIEDGNLDYDLIYGAFLDQYGSVVRKYAKSDPYIEEYIETYTRNALDTTWNHLNFGGENEYWTSDARATENAVNEANSILNYQDLKDAIDAGYTFKTWVAEVDRRTRKDHLEITGTKIPIRDKFKFPDCEMVVPHDEVNGTAEQTANCRCSVKFTRE